MGTPDFFVPGAQKCGTKTLYRLLKQHPQCFIPEKKEPQSLAFPNYPREAYCALFPNPDTPEAGSLMAVGDASTSYLVVPHVPSLILSEFGRTVRFLFILRDPATRTLSAYLHMYKRGHERRDWNDIFHALAVDEVAAVNAEARECASAAASGAVVAEPYRSIYGEHALWPYRYLHGSLYSLHLDRFINLFGRQSCHFVVLEELKNDPQTVIREVYRFLGLDEDFVPDEIGVVWNKTAVPTPPQPFLRRIELDRFFCRERERVSKLLGRTPAGWVDPISGAASA